MTLHYTYDPSSPLGQVRLALGDAPDDVPDDLSGTPRAAWKCVFADEEIAPVLADHNDAVLETAAALCLRAAASATYLSNLIRVGDFQLDNKGLAEALRAQAAAYLAQAAAEPAEAIVEPIGTIFQAREQLLRGLLSGAPTWWLP
jgi:hypothetical protein